MGAMEPPPPYPIPQKGGGHRLRVRFLTSFQLSVPHINFLNDYYKTQTTLNPFDTDNDNNVFPFSLI